MENWAAGFFQLEEASGRYPYSGGHVHRSVRALRSISVDGANSMEPNREFVHNHYIPKWYQRRFMLSGQRTYWYRDLEPKEVVQQSGHKYTRRALLRWGPDSCFAEDGLYTTKWGAEENVDIEKFFFG